MRIFNSFSDVKQYYSEQMEYLLCPECYSLEFEELVIRGAQNYVELMNERGFKYGNTQPDSMTTDDVFACIEEFAI